MNDSSAVLAQPNWCLFEALSSQQSYSQIGALSLSVGIWIWLSISFKNHRKHKTFQIKEIRIIHYIIFEWGIAFSGKLLLNIIIFKLMISDEDNNLFPSLKYFNFVYFMLDTATAVLINSLLIFVPLHWLKTMLSNLQLEELPPEIILKRDQCKNILQYFLVYNEYRWITILLDGFLIMCFFLDNYSLFFVRIVVSTVIFEAVIIAFLYVLGMYVLSIFSQILSPYIQKQCVFYARYSALALICFFRLAWNVIFWFIYSQHIDTNWNCKIDISNVKNMQISEHIAIFIGLGFFFMHIVPVSIVLVAFSPTQIQNIPVEQHSRILLVNSGSE